MATYRKEGFLKGMRPSIVGASPGTIEYGRIPSVWQKSLGGNLYAKVAGAWVSVVAWVMVDGVWVEAVPRGKVSGAWLP